MREGMIEPSALAMNGCKVRRFRIFFALSFLLPTSLIIEDRIIHRLFFLLAPFNIVLSDREIGYGYSVRRAGDIIQSCFDYKGNI